MSTAPAPPPFLDAPELPEGAPPRETRPRWRPWTSLAALVAGFGGALLGALVIGVVAAAFGADFDDPPPAVNIIGTIVQDACLVGSALLFARMAAVPRPEQFGLRTVRFWPALGWVLLAFVGFYLFTAGWVAALGLDPEEEALPDELGVDESTAALVAVAFLVTVVAPVAEEFFFRGYFFTALRNWKGLWPAAVLTGLVFGAIHLGSSQAEFLVPLAFFGFALCLLYAVTGSLYPCIGLHCVNNSLAFGISQDWTWEIPVLLTAALVAIALGALAVRRMWAARPAV